MVIKAALLLTMFAATLPAGAQELIVNGGFETGNFSNWNNPLSAVVNDSARPHTGARNARFPNGTLSQTFSTVPGTEYLVSYWVAHTGNNTFNSFIATVNDGSLRGIQTLFNQGPTGYALTIFTYVAASTSSTLRFTTTFTDFGGGLGGSYVLDDVSVKATPELDGLSARLPLLMVALLLGLRARRRA